jgi:hypothetical protein
MDFKLYTTYASAAHNDSLIAMWVPEDQISWFVVPPPNAFSVVDVINKNKYVRKRIDWETGISSKAYFFRNLNNAL